MEAPRIDRAPMALGGCDRGAVGWLRSRDRMRKDAHPVTLVDLELPQFFHGTDDLKSQRGDSVSPTNHSHGIKHDRRGMDAPSGFAN
jgi:hypothetical protein